MIDIATDVTSADGTSIANTAIGAGPPVVFVGGTLSHRRIDRTGRVLARALAETHRVYTYDRRGRGASGDGSRYAVAAEVDDLAALIDTAGGEADLVGFDSGAVLALEAAISDLPIRSLALYEPPFVVTSDRPPVESDYRDRIDLAVADGRRADAVALYLAEVAAASPEKIGRLRDSPSWSDLEQLAHTLSYDAAIMDDAMSGDETALLAFSSVRTPALVLHAEASTPWICAAARSIASVLDNATVVSIPEDGWDFRLSAIAATLTEWLSSDSVTPSSSDASVGTYAG